MRFITIVIIIAAVILAAAFAAVWFGLTTLPFPGRKTKGSRIACVGDSITYGCTIPGCFVRSYPRVLRKLLGKGFCVCNFGVNDRTAQSTGNKPYCREKVYRRSLAFKPEIVVMLFGSNDSKANNWVSDEHFIEQYEQLIREYTSLPSCRKLILCTPPAAYSPIAKLFYLTNDVPADKVGHTAELVRKIADNNDLPMVDFFALTQERRDLFGPDGLHPNVKGARFIAETVMPFCVE